MKVGNGLRIVFGLAALMIAVQIINVVTGYSLLSHGLLPRTLTGLQGILFAPVLHGSVRHLLGNLLPFVVLSALVLSEGVSRYVRVTMLIVILGGLMVWVIGRPLMHVGASGVIFGLWTYLLARAWYQRSLLSLAVATIALIGYSGLLLGFVPVPGVSIESHLCGAIAGIFVAWLMHGKSLGEQAAT